MSLAMHVLDFMMLPAMPATAHNADRSDLWAHHEAHLSESYGQVVGASHYPLHVHSLQRKCLCAT